MQIERVEQEGKQMLKCKSKKNENKIKHLNRLHTLTHLLRMGSAKIKQTTSTFRGRRRRRRAAFDEFTLQTIVKLYSVV